MKLYIFITGSITLVGGAELYVAAKKRFLEDNNWKVIVVSTRKGKPFIDELSYHSKFVFECLSFSPFYYNKHKRDKIINDIVSLIKREGNLNGYKDLIVESSSQYLSLWGEMISAKLGARHILFFLQEKYKPASQSLSYFYEFKLKRKEFACIRKKGVQMLLPKSDNLTLANLTELCASEGMPVSNNCNQVLSKIQPKDYSITILGRLDKEYVFYGTKAVLTFAKKYRDKRINLLLVGDNSPENKKKNKQLKKMVAKQPNLTTFFTGNLYPIPKQLFDNTDIFIAGSGCASIAAYYCSYVITVYAVDNKAMGFLGYSTTSTIFRQNEPLVEIETLLENGLLRHEYGSSVLYDNWKKEKEQAFCCSKVFQQHLDFIKDDSPRCYFDFSSIKNEKSDTLLYLLLFFFGYRLTNALRLLVNRLKKWAIKLQTISCGGC